MGRLDAAHLSAHRFVEVDGDTVLGWVAAAPTSTRAVYSGVVEESVYVADTARGRGVGRRLLDALIDSTERCGIWTIETGSFPRTLPASPCTSAPGSGASASASGWVASRAGGATSCC